jgi:hypothetical protein
VEVRRCVPETSLFWFSENLGWNLHISKLVTKGNKTAAELGRVFAMRKLPIKIKSKVWTTMVRSVLEYCAMVWKTDAKKEKYLESFQHQDSKDKLKGQPSGFTIYPRSSKPRYAEKRYETSLPG